MEFGGVSELLTKFKKILWISP